MFPQKKENDGVFYFQHCQYPSWFGSKGLVGTPWVLMKCIKTMKLCGLSTVYLRTGGNGTGPGSRDQNNFDAWFMGDQLLKMGFC